MTYTDVTLDGSEFPALGADFETTGAVTVGRVGSATARLFPLAQAVGFATAWLTEHRPQSCDGAHTPREGRPGREEP